MEFNSNLLVAGKIVLEALVLTAGVVASLTAYAFWASKKGKEFGYLGPILSSALTILVLTSFLQVMPVITLKECTLFTNTFMLPLEQSTACNNCSAECHAAGFLPIGTCVSWFVRRAWSFGVCRLHSV